jgi:hypothetical protein
VTKYGSTIFIQSVAEAQGRQHVLILESPPDGSIAGSVRYMRVPGGGGRAPGTFFSSVTDKALLIPAYTSC